MKSKPHPLIHTAVLLSGLLFSMLSGVAQAASATAIAERELAKANAALAEETARLGEIDERLARARERLDQAARELADLHKSAAVTKMHGGGRAMLGVLIDQAENDKGVLITGITPGSGAAAAGLRSGDLIVGLNSQPLDGAQMPAHKQMTKLMDLVKPGETVNLELLRKGNLQLADVVTQPSTHRMFAKWHKDTCCEHEDVQIDLEFNGKSLSDLLSDVGLGLESLGDGAHLVKLGGAHSNLVDLNPDLAEYFSVDAGVLVVHPPKQGKALRSGDVIVSVEDQPVTSVSELLKASLPGDKKTADSLSIGIVRRGEAQQLDITRAAFASTGRQTIRINSDGADIQVSIVADDSP